MQRYGATQSLAMGRACESGATAPGLCMFDVANFWILLLQVPALGLLVVIVRISRFHALSLM